MSQAQYRTLCRVDRNGTTYLTGSTIALPDDTAARLLAMDPPAIEVIAPTESPVPPAPERANAKQTIERIGAMESVAELVQLRDAEEAHELPRKTVLEAIDARLRALADDDAGDADDDEDHPE